MLKTDSDSWTRTLSSLLMVNTCQFRNLQHAYISQEINYDALKYTTDNMYIKRCKSSKRNYVSYTIYSFFAEVSIRLLTKKCETFCLYFVGRDCKCPSANEFTALPWVPSIYIKRTYDSIKSHQNFAVHEGWIMSFLTATVKQKTWRVILSSA